MATRHEAIVLGIERGTGLTFGADGGSSDVLKARIGISPPLGDLAFSRARRAVDTLHESRKGSTEETQNDRVRVLTTSDSPKNGLKLEGRPGSAVDSVPTRGGEMVEGNVVVVYLRASGPYPYSNEGEERDFNDWYTRIGETAYPLARRVADVVQDAANFNLDAAAEQHHANRTKIELVPRPAGFEG